MLRGRAVSPSGRNLKEFKDRELKELRRAMTRRELQERDFLLSGSSSKRMRQWMSLTLKRVFLRHLIEPMSSPPFQSLVLAGRTSFSGFPQIITY